MAADEPMFHGWVSLPVGPTRSAITEDEVRAAALSVWNLDSFAAWYDAPNRGIHNATPRQYVQAGDGDKVIALLWALAEGVVMYAPGSPGPRERRSGVTPSTDHPPT